MYIYYLQSEVNHLCIKDITGDPGWNLVGPMFNQCPVRESAVMMCLII